MAQLARFFHWSPDAVGALNGDEMVWWADQANIMLDRERPRP